MRLDFCLVGRGATAPLLLLAIVPSSVIACDKAEPAAQAKQTARASTPLASASGVAGGGTPAQTGSAAVPTVSAAPAVSTPSAPVAPGGDVGAASRVYAKTRFVWIRPEPDASKQWIGYLWTGESAPLVTGKPVYGPGCMYWYAVEPVGFVCVDGLRATLDANDAGYKAVKPYAAQLDSAWPHQYGETQKVTRLLALEGSPLAFPNLPSSVHDGRVELRRGSTLAYVSEVKVGEHDYLLGADLTYVPKQLVTPYPHYEYRGIELAGEMKLPLALFRSRDQPKLKQSGDGFVETGEKFARLSHVALTGKTAESGGERLLETAEGSWVREKDAVVPVASSTPPWGTAPAKGRGTWIEVSVTGGWLIAYENLTPVFTTLISPGRGGPAKPDEDPIAEARTPLGVYPVSGKFATATMEAPGNLIHSEVPWTQNFSGPHALHAAYWHDDWGNYKSGGCINVSPLDGKHLFEWTDPPLPAGWHGIRWMPWRGPSTILIVHR